MEYEHKEAIREANRRRALTCHKCGSPEITERDGAEIGGMPGVRYRYCGACGATRAKTTRRRRGL